MQLVIQGTYAELERIKPFVLKLLGDLSRRQRDEIAVAVHELCYNIIQHGYADLSGDIALTFERETRSLNVSARDTGARAGDDAWRLPILYNVMDDVQYRSTAQGNEWLLRKHW